RPACDEKRDGLESKTGVKVLAIATDGFGGHGGIALYTSNLLRSTCSHPSRPRVVAVPRVMPFAPEGIPENLEWDVSGLGGKGRYAGAVMRAALREGPFDVVLCTHVHLLSLAYPVARWQKAPLVLFMYGIEVKQPTRKWLSNRFAPRVDAVVSIRRHTTQAFQAWAAAGDAPEYLLENAIDLTRYGLAPKAPDLVARFGLEGKRVIMTLNRLEERNIGVDEVLGALHQVARASPDVAYLVAGEGPDLPRLREKAAALGVADRVVFAGFVPADRKADYYRLGDVYAMPGSGPSFDRYPLRFAFLEAMACGVPVVGSRCEDDEERLLDGSLLAHQVDPYDSEAIASAITEALSRPKAVPPGLERFGYPAFEARWHGMIDQILSRPRRRASIAAPRSAAVS
ncbi:MAG: glycosyltransferase family 4 protein, partial [Myxococcota bacterium]|nr:glycosyltransferase family 4 protein [Myxococcota bacterium]